MSYQFTLVLVLWLLESGHSQEVRECEAKRNDSWSYFGENGPNSWGRLFEQCRGSMQSPINIDTYNSTTSTSPEDRIRLTGYRNAFTGVMKNTGDSVKITPTDRVERSLSYRNSVYKMDSLHIHFGSRRNNGTEHTIDGEAYDLEIHIVHKGDNDSIAVVALLFKESLLFNPWLAPITLRLSRVRFSGQEQSVRGFRLQSLLPNCWLSFLLDDRPLYFIYDGSLTQPGCREGVKFFVFGQINHLSSSQMRSFRSLQATKPNETPCPMADNIRPVQEVNGRNITAYSGVCRGL